MRGQLGLGPARRARPGRGGGSTRRSPRCGRRAQVWRTSDVTTPAWASPTSADGLERLVGEVQRVALVDEDVVGRRREHHPLGRAEVAGWRRCVASARSAASDERVSTKRRYQPPTCSRSWPPSPRAGSGKRGARPRVSRLTKASAWTSASGRSDGSERRQQVGHGDQHGEPGAPPVVPVGRAEVERFGHDGLRAAGLQQTEGRLGHDQGDPLLEPVPQAAPEPADRIGVGPGGDERPRRPASATSNPMASSAQGSSVQPLARSKRAWCQWQVTQAGLDRALVQREAEVGAAILDGEGSPVVPHDEHRERPDLGQQAPIALRGRRRSRLAPRVERHGPSLRRSRANLSRRGLCNHHSRSSGRELARADVSVEPVVHRRLLPPDLDHAVLSPWPCASSRPRGRSARRPGPCGAGGRCGDGPSDSPAARSSAPRRRRSRAASSPAPRRWSRSPRPPRRRRGPPGTGSSWSGGHVVVARADEQPAGRQLDVEPGAPSPSLDAAAAVLYGLLSFEKRTSRYGRNKPERPELARRGPPGGPRTAPGPPSS